MQTLFVYSLENNKLVARITGTDNGACEAVAAAEYGSDDFGSTYSPAFGSAGGVDEGEDVRDISA